MRTSRSRVALVLVGVAIVTGCNEGAEPQAAPAQAAPTAAGAAQDTPDFDRLLEGESLYSQHKEELVIRHFFRDRRGGFFVDVGAYHWQKASTTLYLEKHLDWSGIALDALPGLADMYAKNRPRTKFFQYIVTDHSGTEESFFVYGPVSSAVSTHIDDVIEAYGMEEPEEKPEGREIQVPTITLDELLDGQGVERIDFLSMDIEQGEPKALAGFDIERFRPALVCIEVFPTTREAIAAYFEEHGYERITEYAEIDANWYFRPKTD